MGTYYLGYVAQVTIETQNSIAIFSMWSSVLFLSLASKGLIEFCGVDFTFMMFAIVTLSGGIYFQKFMKVTEGLTSAECKQLYWPSDLKLRG